MPTKKKDLSAHGKKVLALLQKSRTPLTAYDILDRLRADGIKAPPTVYRALDALVARGDAHRVASLGAYIACHHHDHSHTAQFAVCRGCGTVQDIHDPQLGTYLKHFSKALKFHAEREVLEVIGLCQSCAKKLGTA